MKPILLLLSLFLFVSVNSVTYADNTVISFGGNAYITNSGGTSREDRVRITDAGIERWKNEADVISVYFHVEKRQTLNLAINAEGNSTIRIEILGKTFDVKLSTSGLSEVPVGEIEVKKPGYVRLNIQGISKEGNTYGNIKDIILKNPEGKITYVHDFSNYWGRRGPSVHLAYKLPDSSIEWFYNEVTVPENGDVIAGYYMANGFGEGYFGIQNNSPSERRVLFSVWSPFSTDNPKDIPEEDQIKMLRRGEDVHIGEFGNEGSGGQSFLRYNWTAGTTYKFLMHVKPDGIGNTIYTAYFFATDENRWRLIASFLRPKTNTWYRNPHSFLENFNPNQGYLSRHVVFGNQWALDVNGYWHELTEATFTYDATANAGIRLDYQGGLWDDTRFYLKNGGFFNQNTKYRTGFSRRPSHNQPKIDLEALENL